MVSALESTRGQNVTSAGREGASGEALEENYLLLLSAVIPFILIATLPLCSLTILSLPACFLRLTHTAKASHFHTENYTNAYRVPRGLPWATAQTVHCTELGAHSQSSLCDE